MLSEYITVVGAILVAVLTSSGMWTYLTFRYSKKSETTKLTMGLAYERLSEMGMRYQERGSITLDEYEDLRKYLYEPYKALGGNGSADRIMATVDQLPITRQEVRIEPIIMPHQRRNNEQ